MNRYFNWNKYKLSLVAFLGIGALFFLSVPNASAGVTSYGPVHTSNGEELRYGTAYYIRDKGLPNRGGLTYEPYASYDHVLFSNVNTGPGRTIMFEKAANKNSKEVVRSGDIVKVRFEGSNWGSKYTYFVRGKDNIYLDVESKAQTFEIYGRPSDFSFALGNDNSRYGPLFNIIQGNRNGSKSWLGYGTSTPVWTPGGELLITTLKAIK